MGETDHSNHAPPPASSENNPRFEIAPRNTAIMISILSLSLSVVDALLGPACYCLRGRGLKNVVNWLRIMLLLLFQLANLLLLLASVFENPTLVQIYEWYTIGFVVAGAVVAVLDFLFQEDKGNALSTFLAEMAFLFVTFRCLPIVDIYRKNLVEGVKPAPAKSTASESSK